MMNRYGRRQSVVTEFGVLRCDYSAAKSSRFRRVRAGLPALGAGADYHYRSDADYLRMMEMARDMDRNDVVIGRVIDAAVINTQQGGIRPDIDTGDLKLDDDLRQGFDAWADGTDCSVDRACNYQEMSDLCLRGMLTDGDILHFPTRLDGRPCIQIMEAHRLRTPQRTSRNIKLGVQKDEHGRPVRYWFTREDVDGLTPVKIGDMVSIDALDAEGRPLVHHVVRRKRASQTRGVTALAPIIETAGQFEDLQFAKLVQAQLVSCLTFKRTRSPDFVGSPLPAATGERSTERLADGSTRTVDAIAPGMEWDLAPGEDVEALQAGVPNAEYFPHVRLVLTLMSVNLGVPLCILMLDGSETNFSGWRGAVDQARIGWRKNQEIIISRFHRPVWSFWVRDFIASSPDVRGALARSGMPIDVDRWASFNPPGYPYIQPVDDARAFALRIQSNQNSLRREHADKGSDWDAVSQELVDDRGDLIEKAIRRADEINRKYPGAGVTWRELAGAEVKPLDPRTETDRSGDGPQKDTSRESAP